MKFKNLLILAMFLTIGSGYYSQENEENAQIPKFGFGMNLTQVRMGELFLTNDYFGAPANSLMITVSPIKWLRIEPQIGYLSSRRTINYYDASKEVEDKLFNVGAGLFGMIQKGKTNIFLGLRYENTKLSSERYEVVDYTVNGYTYAKYTSVANRNTLSPTIGGEYFIGSHFSFGGEFGLRIMSIVSNDGGTGSTDEKNSMTSTDAAIQFRVYF